MLGFKPLPNKRIAIRNDLGGKIGYLVNDNGKQNFTDPEGKTLALNVRFKQLSNGRVGAQGGSFAPSAWWPDEY